MPVFLDASLGLRGMGRHLSFSNDASGTLRPYDLDLAPAVTLAADFFPGALATRGPLAHVGLTGGFEYAFGIASQNTAAQSFPTTAYAWFVGLLARAPIGPHELRVSVTGTSQLFQINSASDGTDPGVPTVAYHGLRVGLGTRLVLGERAAILLGFGYRYVFDAGAFTATYFPHAAINAVDGMAGLAVRLAYGLEIRASLDLTYFFTNVNPQPMDTYQVGGASDLFYGGTLALALRR
jgi:hypothetical protein